MSDIPNCASDIHNPPVPADVSGRFTNPWNPEKDRATFYCDFCSIMIADLGFFVADEINQVNK